MGNSSQRKGRAAELELVRYLQERGFNAAAGEPLNYGTEPDVTGLPGLHIEVKRCERLELPKWWEQAERDAERFQDGQPVVIFRRNRRPWMICLQLCDFLRIFKKARSNNDSGRNQEIH